MPMELINSPEFKEKVKRKVVRLCLWKELTNQLTNQLTYLIEGLNERPKDFDKKPLRNSNASCLGFGEFFP